MTVKTYTLDKVHTVEPINRIIFLSGDGSMAVIFDPNTRSFEFEAQGHQGPRGEITATFEQGQAESLADFINENLGES